MIKVFKLWKGLSWGNTTPEYRIYDTEYWGDGKEYEEDWVREWAENDSAGSNNGYTVYWEEVTDENIIRETIDNSISSKERQIKSLENEIKELISFKNKYRKEKLEKLSEI